MRTAVGILKGWKVPVLLLNSSLIPALFLLWSSCSSSGPSDPPTDNRRPTAQIISPLPGTYALGSALNFHGAASDPEDGPLAGSSLVWTSSRQGQIGTGSSFTRGDLDDGIHSIALTAVDSRGATGSALTVITIEGQSSPRISLGLSNEDGFLDASGVFQSARGAFLVDDGEGARADSLVYELQVVNESEITATGITVRNDVDPSTGIIRWRQTLFTSQGNVVNASDNGFTWNIGTLGPRVGATLRFRAHALRSGNSVNRASLSADNLSLTIVNEQLTSIGGLEVDLSNHDGFLDANGTFQSAEEAFFVGDGGPGDNSLIFNLEVTNQSDRRATGIRVVDLTAPHSGIFAWRQTLFISQGSVVGASAGGFTWNIGDLPPSTSAVLRFRAEALARGDDVNRAILTFDQLGGPVVLEELTNIE